ncbi:MAG TPA: Maf family protein [Candidatus Deferrimicrobium sp.]|nr:Maf family protein [Candidatus Deferrimicrobium sp.]
MTLYLASESPRRKMLFEKLGVEFKLLKPRSEKLFGFEGDPVEFVKNKALIKAKSVLNEVENGAIIVSADTIVVINGEILEKPKNKTDAIRMLTRLSDNSHFVYTALVILDKAGKMEIEVEKTKVEMRAISAEEIQRYVDTEEPLDAAGAYKIQETGMKFIKRIEGCFYNVIGLPVSRLVEMLKQFDINV